MIKEGSRENGNNPEVGQQIIDDLIGLMPKREKNINDLKQSIDVAFEDWRRGNGRLKKVFDLPEQYFKDNHDINTDVAAGHFVSHFQSYIRKKVDFQASDGGFLKGEQIREVKQTLGLELSEGSSMESESGHAMDFSDGENQEAISVEEGELAMRQELVELGKSLSASVKRDINEAVTEIEKSARVWSNEEEFNKLAVLGGELLRRKAPQYEDSVFPPEAWKKVFKSLNAYGKAIQDSFIEGRRDCTPKQQKMLIAILKSKIGV